MANKDFFSNDSSNLQPQSAPVVIPVIEETATIGKKTIETGTIKIAKSVVENKEVIDVSLLSDGYVIEHVPMNTIHEQAPQTRQEGDTLIVPVLKEVLVKRLMLVEEIRITKKVTERTEQHQVFLKTESVTVNRVINEE